MGVGGGWGKDGARIGERNAGRLKTPDSGDLGDQLLPYCGGEGRGESWKGGRCE